MTLSIRGSLSWCHQASDMAYMVPDDGKHAFSMIGVHGIEATILWRGGFGGRGGAPWVGGLARFGLNGALR